MVFGIPESWNEYSQYKESIICVHREKKQG